MNNILQELVLNDEAVVDHRINQAPSSKDYEFSTAPNSEEAINDAHVLQNKVVGRLKSIGLFFASPFIALGYIFALPFVGMFMFSRLAMEAYAKRRHAHS